MAAPTTAERTAIYTCPMHPEIRQQGPGNCPIWGMALEPLEVTTETGANPELADMRHRFWIGLALTAPVFVLEMGGHLPMFGRLHYVAATRARDLLLLPRHSGAVSRDSWLRLLEPDLEKLEPFGGDLSPANVRTAEWPPNRQDPDTFAQEAETIMASIPRLARLTPHLAEGDEDPEVAAVVAED